MSTCIAEVRHVPAAVGEDVVEQRLAGSGSADRRGRASRAGSGRTPRRGGPRRSPASRRRTSSRCRAPCCTIFAAHIERALLAVHELLELPRRLVAAHLAPLGGRSSSPTTWCPRCGMMLVGHAERVVEVDVAVQSIRSDRDPLAACALVVEAQQLVAAVLCSRSRRSSARGFRGPIRVPQSRMPVSPDRPPGAPHGLPQLTSNNGEHGPGLESSCVAHHQPPAVRMEAAHACGPGPVPRPSGCAGDRRARSGRRHGRGLAQGNVVFGGYWQQPEATAEAMAGGWFHTGDGGRLDDAGYITISDRRRTSSSRAARTSRPSRYWQGRSAVAGAHGAQARQAPALRRPRNAARASEKLMSPTPATAANPLPSSVQSHPFMANDRSASRR